MLCVGPKDMEAGTTGLRKRGQTVDSRGHNVDDVLKQLQQERDTKAMPSDLGNEEKDSKAQGGGKKGGHKAKGKAVQKKVDQPEFTKVEVKVGYILEVCFRCKHHCWS